MKTLKSRGMQALAIALSLITLNLDAAVAGPFSAIYAIGASRIDAGNANRLTDPILRPAQTDFPPYALQRYTNGYNYLDRVSFGLFGTPMAPSILGGANYAYAGAVPGSTAPIPFFPSPPILTYLQQRDQIIADAGGALDMDALYVVDGGGNAGFANALLGFPLTPAEVAMSVADDIEDIVLSLAAAGAKNFFLAPVGSATPFIDFSLFAGLNVIHFDTSRLISEAIANPAAFGVVESRRHCSVLDLSGPSGPRFLTYDPSQTESAWLAGGGVYDREGFCSEPNRHLSIDGIHLTVPVHDEYARRALAAIPAPGSELILIGGLLALGLRGRIKRKAAA